MRPCPSSSLLYTRCVLLEYTLGVLLGQASARPPRCYILVPMHVSSDYNICVVVLLYMFPQLLCVSSYCSMCVLILLYVSLYYYVFVRIMRCICVLVLLYICPHTSIFVSSYYYICVLILYVSSYWPHTTICVLILLYISPRATI